jgi:hypothetical protein
MCEHTKRRLVTYDAPREQEDSAHGIEPYGHNAGEGFEEQRNDA